MDALTAWLFAMMMALVPNGYDGSSYYVARDAHEAKWETIARFQGIAAAAAAIANDPQEVPLFVGVHGRAKTGALLLAIAYHESGYSRAVDYGIGRYGRGDGGRSWCLMQLNLGKQRVKTDEGFEENSHAVTAEGWTGRDLVADREKCFRAALHVLQKSFGCGGGQDRLTAYASGKCVTKQDQEAAQEAGNLKEVARISHIRHVSAKRLSTAGRYYQAAKSELNRLLFEDN